MTRNENSRPNSVLRMIVNNNNNNESEAIEESEENRFRTYNVKDLKSMKSYLPKEVLRDFKKEFEVSSKTPTTPKSRNFVRKLVATLENKKYQGSGHCTADDEFFSKCYSRPKPENYVSCQKQEKKINCFETKNFTKLKNLNNLNKKNIKEEKEETKDFTFSKQEALVNLTIDEYIKLNSDNNDHCIKKKDTFDNKINFWSSKNDDKFPKENHSNHPGNIFRSDFPQSSNEIDFEFRAKKSESTASNIFTETKNRRSIFRRSGHFEEKKSFKEILSSLIGLKSRNPSLPKGKRNNIFNPKDSLGEEMRLFRRDLMPVLLKSSKPYKNDFEDISKDDTFSSMFAASKPQCDNRSASIHPFYGGKKGAPKFLHTLEEENLECQKGFSESKSQFQQKERKIVPLREQSPPLYQRPPEIIYDVPKSKKVTNFASNLKNDENFNTYQNIEIFDESNWCKISNPIPRKNIVCGKRALFIRKRKQEK